MKHWFIRVSAPIAVCVLVGCAAVSSPAPSTRVQHDSSIELISKYALPETRVWQAINQGVLPPRTATDIRESLNRLWSLGIFENVRVTEVERSGERVLQYHLDVRPTVKSVNWQGEFGLDEAQLAAVVDLPLGGSAEPERLDKAREELIARYAKEGFFEATVEVKDRQDPATNGRDITFVLDSGQQFHVGRIEFEGAHRVPQDVLAKAFSGKRVFIPIEFITGAFGQRVGRPYQEKAVRDGLEAVRAKLGEEGFFEARVNLRKPELDTSQHKVNLHIDIVEGPKFEVTFSGNDNLGESVLRKQLAFAAAGVVDEAEVSANARLLESFYQEKGYHFVRVTGKLERSDGNGSDRIIHFDVNEGPRVTVESVTLEGNQEFPSKTLLSSIQTGPPGILGPVWFGSGLFRQQVLDADLRSLESFYRTHGYTGVKVGPARLQFTDDRSRVRITIPIVEGARLTVGQIGIHGVTLLTPDEIKQAVPLVTGQPWNPAKLGEGRNGLLRLFTQKGYLQARVKAEGKRHGDRMDVTYTVDEGKQTRIGRVLVQGLLLTRKGTIMRELSFHEGEPLNPEKLSEAQRKLSAFPQFESVRVTPKKESLDPLVSDVEIHVREGKPWRLDVGAGYNTDVGAGGFVEVSHDNLWGTRRSISFREQVNQRGLLSDLALRDPYVFNTNWQGELGLRWEMQDPQNVGYKFEKLGFRTSVQKALFEEDIHGLTGELTYRLDRVRRYDIDPSLAPDDIKAGTEIVASLTPSFTLDRRDNKVNPTSGSLQFTSLETAGTMFGSDANFMKFRFESYWFFNFLPPTVFALSGRLGLATPFGNANELPIEDRFYAGGETTIRGYLENEVGPLNDSGEALGGDALLIFNLEWRFPIWKILGGALFVDTGTVTNKVNDLFDTGFKTGVGGGLRVLTPVGPVRVDVGYALNPIRQDSRWQAYFSVGNPF
jgi:outer membrane protein insertion porin family